MKTTFRLACLSVAMLACSALAQERPEITLPEPTDNAAVSYLKAVIMLSRPSSTEEIERLNFIEDGLQKLPPQALAERQDVRDLLGTEGLVIQALRQGAARPRCNFDLAYAEGPGLILNHLAQMRRLARHALAIAKLRQLEGDALEAARIHADVLQLAAHLDQDMVLISGLVGVAIVRMTVVEIEGLLSRDPAPEAVRELLNRLNALPAPLFHPDRYVRLETQIFGDWLLANWDQVDEIGEMLATPEGQLPWPDLPGKSTEEVQQLFTPWIRDYQLRMDALADVMTEPYPQARPKLQQMVQPQPGNPLIAVLMPELARITDRFAEAQAQLGMARLACAAVLFKAEHEAFATRLEHLQEFFPQALPSDPFTGAAFTYALEEGLPRVACNPPDDLLQQQRPEQFSLNLARRRAADEAALTEAER